MSRQLKLPTLLVIADNPSIRFWIKKQLEDEFFIIGAESRREVLEALNARLDFIILDSEFEECDALELCKEISRLTQNTGVPILLVTGRLKQSYRDRAIEAGVSEFLSDHLDHDELQVRIVEGRKVALLRQKTEDLGLAIKAPKRPSDSYLKNKQVKKGKKESR